MTEKQLNILGDYFVNNRLREKYGWTFEEYLDKHNNGVLDWLYSSY